MNKQCHLKDMVFIYVVAFLFFIIGGRGLYKTHQMFDEYRQSSDVRTLQATITSMTVENKNDNQDSIYYVKMNFTVNNKIYSCEDYYKQVVKVGDQKRIKVYRTKKGTYKHIKVEDSKLIKFDYFIYYAQIFIGLLFTIKATVMVVKNIKTR